MTPFREVAALAMYEWNYKYSIGEGEAARQKAREDAEKMSFEEIRDSINSDSIDSINYGMYGIVKTLADAGIPLTDMEIDQYRVAVFNGPENDEIFTNVSEKIKQLDDPAKLIIASLFQIHDGWVDSHEAKFSQPGRNKQFQHMPTELIGLSQTKLDLVFLKPILAASGIEIDDATLEAAYNDAVMKFLAENDIKSTEDLIAKIQQGAQFYPALEGQDSITTQLADPEFVRTVIIPQIEKNGIGKIEDFIAAHTNRMEILPDDLGNASEGVSGAAKKKAGEAMEEDMEEALNVGLEGQPTTGGYDDGPSA